MPNALRFRFSRNEKLKYIAHLDILRLFERSLKRSGLPVAYSQGFNPREKLVFALPMAMGLTSEAEYADIEFDRDVPSAEFIQRLNNNLPDGVRIIDAVPFEGRTSIMSQITSARYEISFHTGESLSREAADGIVRDFLSKDEIMVMKKTKKGQRPVNIKPLIYSMSVRKNGVDGYVIEAFLSAGAENNLRPDLLMDAFSESTGLGVRIGSMHRKELYASVRNEWKNPFEVANDQ